MKTNGKDISRRHFLTQVGRGPSIVAIGSVAGFTLDQMLGKHKVWQIDPEKCTQCGRCADYCVLPISAVKCYHAHEMCGYCDLCGGYLKPESKSINTGAENQLCPTGAIKRSFVEDPYYEYTIDEKLCIGCAKCVKGCSSFGNGSLYLQIDRKICTDCNLCSIARLCPADAIIQVSVNKPYRLRGTEG